MPRQERNPVRKIHDLSLHFVALRPQVLVPEVVHILGQAGEGRLPTQLPVADGASVVGIQGCSVRSVREARCVSSAGRLGIKGSRRLSLSLAYSLDAGLTISAGMHLRPSPSRRLVAVRAVERPIEAHAGLTR